MYIRLVSMEGGGWGSEGMLAALSPRGQPLSSVPLAAEELRPLPFSIILFPNQICLRHTRHGLLV